jgi:predicted phosphodiesterase
VTQRIVILPDTQLPFESRRELRAVLSFIGETQPDQVIHIGDVMDYPTPSRWSKGSAEEFSKVLKKHNEHAKRNLLGPLREVYDGWVGFHEGNHDLRARAYLSRYAPALAEFEDAFSIKELLDFDGFGIEMLPDFHDVAPGWITTHGHMGKMSLSQIAGCTALNAAKKFGKSVVCGHTHRAGLLSYTFGYGGKEVKTVTGMEVGHLMNMRDAAYLQNATGNWQMAFGMLTVDKTHVKPEIVPISRGRFTVDGETWEV